MLLFTNALKDLKAVHLLKYVYCWHSMMGYWGGVSPNFPGLLNQGSQHSIIHPKLCTQHKVLDPTHYQCQPVMAGMGVVDQPAVLFEAMHSVLSQAGETACMFRILGPIQCEVSHTHLHAGTLLRMHCGMRACTCLFVVRNPLLCCLSPL